MEDYHFPSAHDHRRRGFSHFLTLPPELTVKRMSAAGGFLYCYCGHADGGEVSVKDGMGEDGKGHIEQMMRIEAGPDRENHQAQR